MTSPPDTVSAPDAGPAPDAASDTALDAAAAPVPAPGDRAERRVRPRRSAALQRASWMAARARNAARRGLLIGSVGSVAVVSTLLVLVVLPREVNRAIRNQLDAIPPLRDTLSLARALDSARAAQLVADAALQATRTVVASPIPIGTDSVATPAAPTIASDTLTNDLRARVARARSTPLVESYRALAESRLLQGDGRVRALLDSIDQTDREREAYAALSGPDARYATFTARLGALGQRLIRAAETRLDERDATATPGTPPPSGASPAAASPGPPRAAPGSPVAASDSIGRDASGSLSTGLAGSGAGSVAASGGVLRDSASNLTLIAAPRVPRAPDSALVNRAAAAASLVVTRERALAAARAENVATEARRTAMGARSNVIVPPVAMLLAALVMGLAIGYATALVIELRKPTVGDEGELERITQSRVVTHNGAPAGSRELRSRRRADRDLPPVLVPGAEAWQQLHLTLTGLGDVARSVRIVSDQPLYGSALAINLAAAAAQESRATLLVEPPARIPVLAMLLRQQRARGLTDVLRGGAELRETMVEVHLGRDVAVDALFAGNVAGPHATQVSLERAAPTLADDLRRLAARYDLTLVVGDLPAPVRTAPDTAPSTAPDTAPDAAVDTAVDPAADAAADAQTIDRIEPRVARTANTAVDVHDVILCARLGKTSLAWLSRTTQRVRGEGHRLRAVLLWATDAPIA